MATTSDVTMNGEEGQWDLIMAEIRRQGLLRLGPNIPAKTAYAFLNDLAATYPDVKDKLKRVEVAAICEDNGDLGQIRRTTEEVWKVCPKANIIRLAFSGKITDIRGDFIDEFLEGLEAKEFCFILNELNVPFYTIDRPQFGKLKGLEKLSFTSFAYFTWELAHMFIANRDLRSLRVAVQEPVEALTSLAGDSKLGNKLVHLALVYDTEPPRNPDNGPMKDSSIDYEAVKTVFDACPNLDQIALVRCRAYNHLTGSQGDVKGWLTLWKRGQSTSSERDMDLEFEGRSFDWEQEWDRSAPN